jgi:CHAT domain-containing protein
VLRNTGAVHWQRLPRAESESAEDLARRYSGFRDQVAMPAALVLSDDVSDFPEQEARSLWKERFAPVAQQLEGVESVILVTSAAMGGVPIGSIVDETGRKILARWALRYAPSASTRQILVERRREERPRSGLFIADPLASAVHVASAMPVPRGLEVATVRSALRGDRAALRSLPPLPWTRSEVKSIAPLFSAAHLLEGPAASEVALAQLAQSGSLAQFDVVHLATHALVDGARPARSALVLSQVDVSPTSEFDGVLTSYEIGEQWKLRADLVTLSACETALGRNILGEGTVGFAYPLLEAGAKSVVASLWSVNDQSSELLMRQFYENWLGEVGSLKPKMSKAEALRKAQLWLRDWRDAKGEQPYAHPYYWSAFVLIGD